MKKIFIIYITGLISMLGYGQSGITGDAATVCPTNVSYTYKVKFSQALTDDYNVNVFLDYGHFTGTNLTFKIFPLKKGATEFSFNVIWVDVSGYAKIKVFSQWDTFVHEPTVLTLFGQTPTLTISPNASITNIPWKYLMAAPGHID